ncbi:MAG: CBS domain-containing protein [Bacillota bacterium]|nr:CBS domain-containing protein [Bacillota bacterium]
MDLIITHENSDFDALAAVVAAARLYPGSYVLLPEQLQPNVRSFVNLHRDLLPLIDPKEIVDDHINLLLIIDTNRRERLGKWDYLIDQAAHVYIYDHHPGDEDIEAEKSSIEAIGATTTILLEILRKKKIKITEFEATLFALGIYEDTGCLTYEITTSRDARAVSYLWDAGLSVRLLQENLRSPLNDIQKRLLEKLIHSSELHELNRRRVLISSTSLNEYVVGASALLQLLDEIEDAGMTIVIIRMTDSIYMAARSRDEDLNLLELLAPFDVRGYPAAVSTHFKGTNTEVVKKRVLAYLKENLPFSLTAGEVASRPVFTLNSDTSLVTADELLVEHNFKGCPVLEKGRLVGIISRRDLRKGVRNELGHAPVKGFMTRQVITASPQDSLTDLRRLMMEHNIGRVPIVNETGKLVGIITRSDILRHLNYFDRHGRSLKKKGSTAGSYDRADGEEKLTGSDEFNLLELMESGLSNGIQSLLRTISRLAERKEMKVYLVGGIIRDLLLRYPLEKDLDFVVIGNAVAFTYALQKISNGTVRHFDRFGTASLYMKNGIRLDFVTARREYYESPAALPRVESSGLKNDLFRRDFTINTMACSLDADNYGRLYDYFNGRQDLRNRLIRVLYEVSFIDDPLRILRAVRFEQRYNFTIEAETLRLIEKAIDAKVLIKVSRQRLNQELRLVFREPSPVRILKRFEQLGIIDLLYPGVKTDSETWRRLSSLEKLLRRAEEKGWQNQPDREMVYLSSLLYGLESVKRSAIIKKLNLSREKAVALKLTCREAQSVVEKLPDEGHKPSTIVSLLQHLPPETIFLAYTLAGQKSIRSILKLYLDQLQLVKPHLNGRDLKRIGLEPGPFYRRVMEDLKKAVLDGELKTKEEEVTFVEKYMKETETGED